MPRPQVRFRVDFGRSGAIGPGKIALLEHIDTGGSLSQAARDLGMSYRRAWQLLGSLNGSFTEHVVLSEKGGRGGGGARLTPFGRQLIDVYREFDAEVQRRAARAFKSIADLTRETGLPGARQRRAAPVVRLKDR